MVVRVRDRGSILVSSRSGSGFVFVSLYNGHHAIPRVRVRVRFRFLVLTFHPVTKTLLIEVKSPSPSNYRQRKDHRFSFPPNPCTGMILRSRETERDQRILHCAVRLDKQPFGKCNAARQWILRL
jgi:hypothetical protein